MLPEGTFTVVAGVCFALALFGVIAENAGLNNLIHELNDRVRRLEARGTYDTADELFPGGEDAHDDARRT